MGIGRVHLLQRLRGPHGRPARRFAPSSDSFWAQAALAEIGEQVRQAMWLAVTLAVLSVFLFRFPEPFLALQQSFSGSGCQGAGLSGDRCMGCAGRAGVSALRGIHPRRYRCRG